MIYSVKQLTAGFCCITVWHRSGLTSAFPPGERKKLKRLTLNQRVQGSSPWGSPHHIWELDTIQLPYFVPRASKGRTNWRTVSCSPTPHTRPTPTLQTTTLLHTRPTDRHRHPTVVGADSPRLGTLSPIADLAPSARCKGVLLVCQAHNERVIGARKIVHGVLQNCSSS